MNFNHYQIWQSTQLSLRRSIDYTEQRMISCRFFLSFFQRESAGAQRIFIDRERTDQQLGSQSRAWLWRGLWDGLSSSKQESPRIPLFGRGNKKKRKGSSQYGKILTNFLPLIMNTWHKSYVFVLLMMINTLQV